MKQLGDSGKTRLFPMGGPEGLMDVPVTEIPSAAGFA